MSFKLWFWEYGNIIGRKGFRLVREVILHRYKDDRGYGHLIRKRLYVRSWLAPIYLMFKNRNLLPDEFQDT